MANRSSSHSTPPYPPWGDSVSWLDINETLAARINGLADANGKLCELAQELKGNLYQLGELMAVAAAGCRPSCAAVCCLHAKPFYNFQDLVYLHLAGMQPPEAGQPVPAGRQTCIYLSSNGCCLDRGLRPWICTWYLCPAMRETLGDQLPAVQTLIARIKQQRLELEECLLELLTGS